MATETWRPVADPFYAPAYSVSSLGRIRRETDTHHGPAGRIRKPCWTHAKNERSEYEYTRLSYEAIGRSFRVATLIAGAFLGPRQPGMEINHKNGNRRDNRVANLEYVTKTENEAHAARTGLKRRGSKHPAAKLTEAQVREIRASKEPGRTIAPRYGVAPSTIWAIRLRYHWRHVA